MTQFIGWPSSNGIAAISIFGAAVAFVTSTVQQVIQRRDTRNERQFQAVHRVIEWVVAREMVHGQAYVDKQAAAIFELRNFPRYYDFTERMLTRLRQKWEALLPDPAVEVLIEEIDLTLRHIRQKK